MGYDSTTIFVTGDAEAPVAPPILESLVNREERDRVTGGGALGVCGAATQMNAEMINI